jgi:hypothetical protein
VTNTNLLRTFINYDREEFYNIWPRSTHTYLSKKDRQCKQYSHLDFISCVTDEIKASPKLNNVACIPSSLAKLINYTSNNLRFCKPSDNETITSVTNVIIESLVAIS